MTEVFWLSTSFLLAAGLSLFATPLVERSAGALRLYDAPDGLRRIHERPVPRLGGVAVYLVALFVVSMVFRHAAGIFLSGGDLGDRQVRMLTGALVGSALLFVVGLVDDLRGLSPRVKSVCQFVAAGIAWYFGTRLNAVALGYGQGVPTGLIQFPLVMLWIVGVTNAFNFIDGLDGLAGGIGVVGTVTVLIVGAALGNFWVLLPAVALLGALTGFLPYNFPKAKLFLGDAGSLSIGFLLAVLSLNASVNRLGAVLVIVPVLAVFIPLLDGALAIIRRWLRHIPVSGADSRHIHHRLLALGISRERTTIILWALAAGMAGFGLLIALSAPFVATSIAILALVGVAILMIYGTNLLSYHELMVAGEVLLSAPARVRRVISDEISALDVSQQLQQAKTVPDVSEILSDAASSFGFLGMELTGHDLAIDRIADHLLSANWAWKLDYPIRVDADAKSVSYVLSVWCSPDQSARPYGAERVARILGPALQSWFESRARGMELESPVAAPLAVSLAKRRRLRIT